PLTLADATPKRRRRSFLVPSRSPGPKTPLVISLSSCRAIISATETVTSERDDRGLTRGNRSRASSLPPRGGGPGRGGKNLPLNEARPLGPSKPHGKVYASAILFSTERATHEGEASLALRIRRELR